MWWCSPRRGVIWAIKINNQKNKERERERERDDWMIRHAEFLNSSDTCTCRYTCNHEDDQFVFFDKPIYNVIEFLNISLLTEALCTYELTLWKIKNTVISSVAWSCRLIKTFYTLEYLSSIRLIILLSVCKNWFSSPCLYIYIFISI